MRSPSLRSGSTGLTFNRLGCRVESHGHIGRLTLWRNASHEAPIFRRRCHLIRLIVCIVLAGAALYLEADALVGAAPIDEGSSPNAIAVSRKDSPQHPAAEPPTGNPLWAVPLERLSATRDRPLFSPSRHPPPVVNALSVAPPPRPAPKPAEPERLLLNLVGTIIGEHDKLGVFIDQTTKLAVRLRVGDVHQGWTLRSIEGREVALQNGQTTAVVALPSPGTTTSPFPTPSASPPLGSPSATAAAKATLHLESPAASAASKAAPHLELPAAAAAAAAPAQTAGAPALPTGAAMPPPPARIGIASDFAPNGAEQLFKTRPPFPHP